MVAASDISPALNDDERPTAVEELFAAGTLSVKRAVEFSSIPRSTLYQLMGDGKLPYSKRGKLRLIPKTCLIRLIASGFRGDAAALPSVADRASA